MRRNVLFAAPLIAVLALGPVSAAHAADGDPIASAGDYSIYDNGDNCRAVAVLQDEPLFYFAFDYMPGEDSVMISLSEPRVPRNPTGTRTIDLLLLDGNTGSYNHFRALSAESPAAVDDPTMFITFSGSDMLDELGKYTMAIGFENGDATFAVPIPAAMEAIAAVRRCAGDLRPRK